jgi:hypothetical protein
MPTPGLAMGWGTVTTAVACISASTTFWSVLTSHPMGQSWTSPSRQATITPFSALLNGKNKRLFVKKQTFNGA